MKTIWRLSLLGLVLAAGGFCVWAVEPPPARTTGKVLVLDNGNILEGNIELHGEQFRIERAMGEVWVPAGKGMRLCADWQEALMSLRREHERPQRAEEAEVKPRRWLTGWGCGW